MFLPGSEQILAYFPSKYHFQAEVKSLRYGLDFENMQESPPLPSKWCLGPPYLGAKVFPLWVSPRPVPMFRSLATTWPSQSQ